jgi:hypothetical protein
MKRCNRLTIALLGLACLVMILLHCCCYGDFKAETWAEHVPASAAEETALFIHRSYYRTDEDFYQSVEECIGWLNKRNYIIVSKCYEYGYDMTRKEVLKCAVIVYRKGDK